VQRCPGRPQARCDEETRVVILRASVDSKGVDDPLKRDGSSNHVAAIFATALACSMNNSLANLEYGL
jgi:hypothetical protein